MQGVLDSAAEVRAGQQREIRNSWDHSEWTDLDEERVGKPMAEMYVYAYNSITIHYLPYHILTSSLTLTPTF